MLCLFCQHTQRANYTEDMHWIETQRFEVETITTTLFLFQVSEEMIKFYDFVYDKAMEQSITDPDKKKAAGTVLKAFHETVRTHSKM